MNKEETKSNNKYSVKNWVREIKNSIKRISNQLELISKVIEKCKTERKWRGYNYQEISSSINEIEFHSAIAFQRLETCNITIYNNWTEKVTENKALISAVEQESISKKRTSEENNPTNLKRKKSYEISHNVEHHLVKLFPWFRF